MRIFLKHCTFILAVLFGGSSIHALELPEGVPPKVDFHLETTTRPEPAVGRHIYVTDHYFGMFTGLALTAAMNYFYYSHDLFGWGPSGPYGGYHDALSSVLAGASVGTFLMIPALFVDTVASFDPRFRADTKPSLGRSLTRAGVYFAGLECAKALLVLMR